MVLVPRCEVRVGLLSSGLVEMLSCLIFLSFVRFWEVFADSGSCETSKSDKVVMPHCRQSVVLLQILVWCGGNVTFVLLRGCHRH